MHDLSYVLKCNIDMLSASRERERRASRYLERTQLLINRAEPALKRSEAVLRQRDAAYRVPSSIRSIAG